MAVKIQPLADYVVVQADKPEEKTASGLYLTQGAQEKPDTALVVAVGKDVKSLKVGDRILFVEEYGKTKTTKIGKDEFAIIKEEHVVALVKE
jgi:chaperonin GroES